MTFSEIVAALVPAHILISYSKPLTAAEAATAAQALREVRALPAEDRIAVHKAVVKAAERATAS